MSLRKVKSHSNSEHDSVEPIYAELPDVDMDEVIVSVQSIHQDLNESFEQQQHLWSWRTIGVMTMRWVPTSLLTTLSMRSSRIVKREVNYLVKEFECKKG